MKAYPSIMTPRLAPWQRKREALRREFPHLVEFFDHPLVDALVEQAVQRAPIRRKDLIFHATGVGVLLLAAQLAPHWTPYLQGSTPTAQSVPGRWVAFIFVSPILIILLTGLRNLSPWSPERGLSFVYAMAIRPIIQDLWLTPLRARDLALIEYASRHCRPVTLSRRMLIAVWIAAGIALLHSILVAMGNAPWSASMGLLFYSGVAAYAIGEVYYHYRNAGGFAARRLLLSIKSLAEAGPRRFSWILANTASEAAPQYARLMCATFLASLLLLRSMQEALPFASLCLWVAAAAQAYFANRINPENLINSLLEMSDEVESPYPKMARRMIEPELGR